MIWRRQNANDADALFDQIDRGAMQFERVAAPGVALQDEAAALTQQHAAFVDNLIQSVASIARAAASGSSACVIGRPMTRIEAPRSSAARGVIIRF